MLKLKSFSDSGHGWLGIKRKDIPTSILSKISDFSYQRGAMVYLEEDCDASLLVNYLKSQNIPFEIVKMKYSHRSPIRSYESFELTQVEKLFSAALNQGFLRIVSVGA